MALTVDDIANMAAAMVEAQKNVELADKALKAAKERLRYLEEETIPCAMQELGVEEIKLATGEKVTSKQDVYAQISVENKPLAFKWLEDNGFSGLIKVELSIDYSKDEYDDAVQLRDELVSRGLNANVTNDIHSQTLKAFLKEQIAAKNNIPLDLFGARPVWKAKISKK